MGRWVSRLRGARSHGADPCLAPHRCIFLELFTRRPAFQGNDEIHQVAVIYDVLGPLVPAQEWPDAEKLPWYDLVRPAAAAPADGAAEQPAQTAEERFKLAFEKWVCCVLQATPPAFLSLTCTARHRFLPPAALAVAFALLRFDPSRRASAAEALQMPYFTTERPRPQRPAG